LPHGPAQGRIRQQPVDRFGHRTGGCGWDEKPGLPFVDDRFCPPGFC